MAAERQQAGPVAENIHNETAARIYVSRRRLSTLPVSAPDLLRSETR